MNREFWVDSMKFTYNKMDDNSIQSRLEVDLYETGGSITLFHGNEEEPFYGLTFSEDEMMLSYFEAIAKSLRQKVVAGEVVPANLSSQPKFQFSEGRIRDS